MAQTIMNTQPISQAFASIAQAFMPDAGAMIQADLARGKRDLMSAQAQTERQRPGLINAQAAAEMARAGLLDAQTASEANRAGLLDAQAVQALSQAGLLDAQAETQVNQRGLLDAQAGQADAAAGLLGAQTVTEGYRPAVLQSEANVNNATARNTDAGTARVTQGTAGNQAIADLMTSPDFNISDPNSRQALIGAQALTEGGIDPADLVGAGTFIDPNYGPRADVSQAIVGAGVAPYQNTGAGQDAALMLDAIQGTEQLESAERIAAANNASAERRAQLQPRSSTGVSPMDLQRIREQVTEALTGETGRTPGGEIAPGALDQIVAQIAGAYAQNGNAAVAQQDVLSRVGTETYDDRAMLNPARWFTDKERFTAPEFQGVGGGAPAPAPGPRVENVPQQAAPAMPTAADFQGLQPGVPKQVGDTVIALDGKGNPIMLQNGQWVPVQ